MTRRRDLSGFGDSNDAAPQAAKVARKRPPAPPTNDRPIVPPPRSSDIKPAETRKARTAKPRTQGKQRITLSLPTSVAALLRATAERESRIYLDIILVAFVDHSAAIDENFIERRRSGESRTGGGRRRADSGRTQIPLNILREDLQELDRRAGALALDRSAYVTELLVRSLKH